MSLVMLNPSERSYILLQHFVLTISTLRLNDCTL